jgi:predicted nuclease of predicted toxin-antitoxin system
MRTVLLDENIPRPLKVILKDCVTATVGEMGWAGLKNGTLLAAANGKFEMVITADKSISYQNNLTGLHISVIILRPRFNKMPFLIAMESDINRAIRDISAGQVLVLK